MERRSADWSALSAIGGFPSRGVRRSFRGGSVRRGVLSSSRGPSARSGELGSSVTDRLHGMIFSVVTGTPCIALDNVSGKVRGVHAWIEDLPTLRFAHDLGEGGRYAGPVLRDEGAGLRQAEPAAGVLEPHRVARRGFARRRTRVNRMRSESSSPRVTREATPASRKTPGEVTPR